MNVLFTDEQVKILMENEYFRKELVNAISETLTQAYSRQYSLLMDRIKSEITNGLIKKELQTNFELAKHIDEKVDKVLTDLVSRSIGKVILKSIKTENEE